MDKPIIVCYMGGTCGDLVSAVIDSTGIAINENGRVILPKDRRRLKRPYDFLNDDEKDHMLNLITAKSIASHDYIYHLKKKHALLCIGVYDVESAKLAAARFKKLTDKNYWELASKTNNISTVDAWADLYLNYSNKLIKTERIKILDIRDIFNGKLLDKLKEMTIEVDPTADSIYKNWLELNLTNE
jgi:hypothetical protein